ncbi:MAG: response regulator [Maricaulis sp.]|nr:response regulator [Maricaulis sp.]
MTHILIIDDNETNREVFKWALADFCTIDDMSDGVGAASKIAESDYDLIFLDLMMPMVDGYEVITELAFDNPDKLKDVVVVTAVLDQDKVASLRNQGVAAIVERPYTPDDIKALYHAHIPTSEAQSAVSG